MNTSGSYQILPLTQFRSGLNSNLIVHSDTLAKSVGSVLTGTTHDLEVYYNQPDNCMNGMQGTNGYYVNKGI